MLCPTGFFGFALFALQGSQVAESLTVGKSVRGEIADDASVVHSPALDRNHTEAPTLGNDYRIVVDTSGPYFIDLRSYDFDAYLVLRSANGELIGENDDGLISTHSRVIAVLEEGGEYRLTACALRAARGSYRVKLESGVPARLSPQEELDFAIKDARAALDHTESSLGSNHVSTGTRLNSLARLLRFAGAYDEARPLYERALSIWEEQLGPEDPYTIVGLNNLATFLGFVGEHENAKVLFERALEILERQVGPNHPDTAAALNGLAFSLMHLGAYEEAKPLFERALRVWEKQLGPDHPTTGTCLNNLAGLLEQMGAYAEAKPLYERALAIRRRQLGPHHPETAAAMNNLGLLHLSMGAYAEAKPLLESSLSIRETRLGPDNIDTGISINNLALLNLHVSEFEEAKPLFERALTILKNKLGSEHAFTVMCMSNLASVLSAIGDYGNAKTLFAQSLEIRERRLGLNHPETATSLSSLGNLLVQLGAFEEAMPLLERGLAVQEKLLDPEHPELATSLNNLGRVLYLMGEYQRAKPLFERALAIREKQLGHKHINTAKSLNNLASLLHRIGAFEEARSLFEQALEIREKRLGFDHPEAAKSLDGIALVLSSVGAVDEAKPLYERALAIRKGRLGPAHPQTTMSAGNLAGLLLDLGEWEDAFELSQWNQAESRVRLAEFLAARTEEEGRRYLSTVFGQQERFLSYPRFLRTRDADLSAAEVLLAWKGQIGRTERAVRKFSVESEETREVSHSLRSLNGELSRLALEPDSSSDSRESRMDAVRKKLTELELELRARLPIDVLDDLNVTELRGLIPANAALVSFFIHRVRQPARREGGEIVERGSWTEPHLVAWIIRGDMDAVSVDLGLASTVEEQTRSFLRGLVGSSSMDPVIARGVSVDESNQGSGSALRKLIWDPLLEGLGEATTVVLSHDGFTGTLPFEVLRGDDGRYLIEDRSFACLHDLQSIGGFGKEVPRAFDSLLCIGDAEFDDRGALDLVESVATRGDSYAPTERWVKWEKLYKTRIEVETIRNLHEELVPTGSRVIVTGLDATEERVVAEMPSASIVHLATHGYFYPQGLPSMWAAVRAENDRLLESGGLRPLDGLLESDRKLTGYLPEVLSGLVFAGANLEREEGRLDGYLTAADVDWLDLSGVELVTLSACETGLGRSESGEGMSGFRTTLLRAGAKTVVSSLWQVPDDSTERLMSRFYENLLRHKMGKLEALREAQLWMLKENRRKFDGEGLPYTWGAFVLSGDWR